MRALLEKIEAVSEESYSGNLGAVEMVKFYQIASSKQQKEMEKLLDNNEIAKAWSLLQRVVGVKLKSVSSKPKRSTITINRSF